MAKKQASPQRTKAALPAKPSLHWPALNGLRGAAALAVLVYHCYLLLGTSIALPWPSVKLSGYGWSGVDVFFVLSAFLLTYAWLHAQNVSGITPSTRNYFAQRVRRIFPAYWLQLVLLIAFGKWFFVDDPRVHLDQSLIEWIAHGALWLHLWPFVNAALPMWWTLPVELGFYLLLPLLVPLLTPRRWWWLLILIVLSIAYRQFMLTQLSINQEILIWTEHLPGRLHQFLVGMLLAHVIFTQRLPVHWLQGRISFWIALCSIVVFFALPLLGFLQGGWYTGSPSTHPVLALWHLLAALAVASLIAGCLQGKHFISHALSLAPMQSIGKLSYGLYLWHFPVATALLPAFKTNNASTADFLVYTLCVLALSLTVATISWHALEKHFLRRRAVAQ